MVWTKTSDGSIVDQNGKVIYFSTTFHRRHLHRELLLHAEQSPRKGRPTTPAAGENF
jgi:hypothetical protein